MFVFCPATQRHPRERRKAYQLRIHKITTELARCASEGGCASSSSCSPTHPIEGVEILEKAPLFAPALERFPLIIRSYNRPPCPWNSHPLRISKFVAHFQRPALGCQHFRIKIRTGEVNVRSCVTQWSGLLRTKGEIAKTNYLS